MTNPNDIGVSIIIPACNNAYNLGKLLSSFLAVNSNRLFELIVIDHESTDNTPHIVAQYAARALIRLIEREGGFSWDASCILGAEKAQYPFLLFWHPRIDYTTDILPDILDRMSDATISAVGVIWNNALLLSHHSMLPSVDTNLSCDDSSSVTGSSLTGYPSTEASDASPEATAAAFMVCRKSSFHMPEGVHESHDTSQASIDFILRLSNQLPRVCWWVNGKWDEHFHALNSDRQSSSGCFKSEFLPDATSVASVPQYRHTLPIVVVAYNRLKSLLRLLHSLDVAHYSQQVELIISVDGGDNAKVVNIAKQFQWRHGPKSVITHTENLGLKAHIIQCSDLALEYDGVVVLEDDLMVSPFFYSYVQQAFDFYHHDERIAGISLYAPQFNETAKLPFKPIHDHSDVFFMQVPASWGVVWSKFQWLGFTEWLAKSSQGAADSTAALPGDVLTWPDSSWKKVFFEYIINTDRWFVYPRISLSTNFADAGVHVPGNIRVFQVPFRYADKSYNFIQYAQSLVHYDAFCEILPRTLSKLCPVFADYNYSVDLYGMKPLVAMNNEYVLTAKKVTDCLCSFGKQLLPLEGNIIHRTGGTELSFARVSDLAKIKTYEILRGSYLHTDSILYHYELPEWVLKTVLKRHDL